MPSTPLRVPKPSVAHQDGRPLVVAIAAVFGALLAAEVLFLGGMPLLSDAGLNRFTVVFLVLFVGAVAGSLMVVQGRRGGWIVLMIVASGGLAAVLILLLVLAALDVAGLAWVAVLLSVGPLGCLVLAPQRSVREWSRAGAARRSAGGRRRAAPSR